MDSLPAKMALGAIGGSGAAIFCHPFDVVRVMMQVQTTSASTAATALEIYKQSGLKRGLYSGLSAAFLRQWTYGAGRIGIYSFLLTGRGLKPSEVSFAQKLGFGVISGGIGSVMGTPAELALVRMSADAKLPPSERRGLGVHKVLGAVVKEKGVLGMWNGVGPTVVRACALSSTTLAVTSECKERLPKAIPLMKESPTVTMIVSSAIASFWATVASQPFDVVKSRIQNMVVPESGVPPYSGAVDCALKTFKEGPLTLFRGFFPAFVKLTPYTVLSLNIVEALTKLLTGKSAL
jgi:solute carrier family 25 oxoglutarate transporter 11